MNNCHGDNNQDQKSIENGHNNHNNNENGHKGHSKHMLLMVLCCAIPIALLLLLPVLKINSTSLKRILPFAVLLLCPLMHVVMMPMMMRKNKAGKGQGHDLHKGQEAPQLNAGQIEDGKGEV